MRKRCLPFRKAALRFWLGAVISLCLLLNQWAVAAYACPADQATLPCHHHADAKQPGLCHQHCDPAPASTVDGKAPTVPPALAPSLAPQTLRAAVAAHDSTLWRVPRDVLTAPPPIIRFCRYLI